MRQPNALIYGAYGYTGELVARQAVRRGLRPVLAGRQSKPLLALAEELRLRYRVFDLEDPTALASSLAGIDSVLHCAGPFQHTSQPMLEACLASGCHYLDITGEISVFESVFAHHEQALEAGIALLPGTGLDVVPTDCLAARLHEQLPDATHLELALATEGSASPGTLVTMAEALPRAGAERVDGSLVPRPAAYATREIEFPHRRLAAMTIPWGDLVTAYRTTGIPNIRVYLATPGSRSRALARLRPLLPLLGSGPIRASLQWWIRRAVAGPSAEVRETARAYFWGEVRNADGETRQDSLTTPEGYRLTARTAVEALRRTLAGGVEPGAWTPATAFGSHFVDRFTL